jgi:hypothetical protein
MLFLPCSVGDISHLASITTLFDLSLWSCPLITDVSPLGNIPILRIDNCPGIASINQLGGEKQKEVYLKSLPLIRDVNSLMNLSKLELIDCNNIIDVNKLGNIRNLKIDSCARIDNLSGLTNVKVISLIPSYLQPNAYPSYSFLAKSQNIILYSCNIVNVSVLSSVIALKFSSCPYLTDLSCLANVMSLQKIVLVSLYGITDITMLGRLKHIEVFDCPIRSIEGLGNVQTLFLGSCHRLLSLYGIHSNYYVKIHDCSLINDFSYLQNVPKVVIRDCPRLIMNEETFLTGRTSYLFLMISSFPSITSLLSSVYMVILSDCQYLEEIKGLTTVPIVHAILCINLVDISGLGENQQVLLRDCSRIKDVSPLARVPDVRIHRCEGITDYSCLETVKRLELNFDGNMGPFPKGVRRMRNAVFTKVKVDYNDIFPECYR